MSAQRTQGELAAWLAQTREDAIDPDLPIIDAHHHMWDRPPDRYGVYELLDELRAGHNVIATVFMECTAMYKVDGPEHLRVIGETEYVNGVAAMSASGIYGPQRLCAGIVGYTDLRQATAREVLEAHVRAGGGRFRGIRHQVQLDPVLGAMARRTPPKDILIDPAFQRGVAELGRMGLTFDAWLYFHQLALARELAFACAGTGIILNHIAAPLGIGPYVGRRDEVFGQWAQGMRALAEAPNVSVKVGGMGMPAFGFGFHERDTPPTSQMLADAWRPYIETCIEAFGADRCMFESNFPVDKQSTDYVRLWNAFKRVTSNCSTQEKHSLFHNSAKRVYGLAL